ncbi:PLC-like phosphodiesterase [Naematelia encephala]|uniref:PLC-like phosphodiesterase n=1 Tax=Naematelia encephala TaxID=71784 RepID=A0A1Y2B270_9TREE|nr:PLC-like phosphodiesterase [Naematelia encephala]
MDIIIHNATLVDVRSSSLGVLPTTSSAKGRRFKVDLDTLSHCDDKIDITFTSKDGSLYQVQVALTPNSRVRQRGWDRLQVTRQDRLRLTSPSQRLDEKTSIGGSGVNMICGYRIQDKRSQRSTVILMDLPDTSTFLAGIPDEISLAELALPGTHESCALYGFPISQCQQPSTPISRQLLDGVRFFDIRLRIVCDQLLVYHGPRPQRSDLLTLLSTFQSFLLSHPSETFIMSVKEEGPPFHPIFSKMAWEGFRPYLDKFWYTENRIPTLGEVRGRGVLLARFDRIQGTGEWECGLGIHPDRWPDSRQEGFEWNCSGRIMRIQDWYRVPTLLNIPEKFQTMTSHLESTLTSQPISATSRAHSNETNTPLTLDYTSAASTALSLPTTMAKGFGWPQWGMGVQGINARLAFWLLRRIEEGERLRGIVAMDFYRQAGATGGELAELLVAMNFLD